jgi:hypothetical protein
MPTFIILLMCDIPGPIFVRFPCLFGRNQELRMSDGQGPG